MNTQEAIEMPNEIYIQFGENRIGTEICMRKWQEKPFDGGIRYTRDLEWKNLQECMPPLNKEFVCRRVDCKYIQTLAVIKMESDGWESPNGGKPYPVLWDATHPDDLCDDEWSNYEWMEVPNE